jgi:hypothetical protein
VKVVKSCQVDADRKRFVGVIVNCCWDGRQTLKRFYREIFMKAQTFKDFLQLIFYKMQILKNYQIFRICQQVGCSSPFFGISQQIGITPPPPRET